MAKLSNSWYTHPFSMILIMMAILIPLAVGVSYLLPDQSTYDQRHTKVFEKITPDGKNVTCAVYDGQSITCNWPK